MKKILISIALFSIAIYLLFSAFFVDVQINKYTDIEAVKDQKAIAHGWVPAILPVSAYEITETHDIDKNELFGSFKYKEADEKAFISQLSKSSNDAKAPYVWENFLFIVDSEKNSVKFRNKI